MMIFDNNHAGAQHIGNDVLVHLGRVCLGVLQCLDKDFEWNRKLLVTGESHRVKGTKKSINGRSSSSSNLPMFRE